MHVRLIRSRTFSDQSRDSPKRSSLFQRTNLSVSTYAYHLIWLTESSDIRRKGVTARFIVIPPVPESWIASVNLSCIPVPLLEGFPLLLIRNTSLYVIANVCPKVQAW